MIHIAKLQRTVHPAGIHGLNDQFHRLQKCVVSVSVKLVIGQVISVHPVSSGVRTFAKIESGMKSRCEK